MLYKYQMEKGTYIIWGEIWM